MRCHYPFLRESSKRLCRGKGWEGGKGKINGICSYPEPSRIWDRRSILILGMRYVSKLIAKVSTSIVVTCRNTCWRIGIGITRRHSTIPR